MIKRNTLSLIAIMILAVLITACGGGGGSNGRVTGTITDNWGAPIGGNVVTIIFAGLETVYHPDETGAFDLSIPEGTYSVEFLWYDNDQGIEIYYTDSVTVVKGQTLNLGNVPLSNGELASAWADYRGGLYADAIVHFNNYLADVRSGHANKWANSALVGLGWCYARTGDYNSAYTNLDGALTASGGTNAEALVGLGGMFLSIGYDGSTFTYDDSATYLSSAINLPGDYTSGPTHDQLSETDLVAARALAYFLDGNTAGAQADITRAAATADAEGNFATLDTLNMLEWLIGNV